MRRAAALAAVGGLLLAGCTAAPSGPGASDPGATPGPAATAGAPTPTGETSTSAASSPGAVPEPTTTNTLPPPPEPTGPDPTTAGPLGAGDLPVPSGWRTSESEGGDEEGFVGNDSWVRARDARYAAQDVMTIGCAPVTRDDYPDPELALEGSYAGRGGRPGVGLVLQFADADAAEGWWATYRRQVQACQTTDDPVRTVLEVDDGTGLVDRRRYADDVAWTEVAGRRGDRVTLVILDDAGGRPTAAAARRLLTRLT